MSEFKTGDRVIASIDGCGVIVEPAPREYMPYHWMVLIDGDKKPCPYMNVELLLENEEE